MAKCTGCGECLAKCPSKAPSETAMGLGQRRAIYKPFSQAVPNVPVIDREHCTYFLKGKCRVCEKVCPAGAIDYEQQETVRTEKFGNVVATGFSLRRQVSWEYGGRYKDVIMVAARAMLDPNGLRGHCHPPSDGREAKTSSLSSVWVAGRDQRDGLLLEGCCMYTAKQAILLKDHFPATQSTVFYIDIRATGTNYEEFIRRAQREYGVSYIRGRVSRIDDLGDKLLVYGADTLVGEPVRVEADLVVLATAMVANPMQELGRC
jgi:heterodisulfide reductase subunit A